MMVVNPVTDAINCDDGQLSMPTLAIRKPHVVLALSGVIAALVFALDVVLPRGATAAIGYCIVPVVVGAARRHRALVVATTLCVLLAWLGFILEPAGAALWMS